MSIDIIGRYRILGVLGEGGMGIVYEAEDDQLHRKVALKIIRGEFVTPELARRFVLESEVLGRLQHPGIAQIYEVGTADGPAGLRSYFAMELVRGLPLTA
ncbi:serine/threonine protein kinase, partial [Gemmatimonas sp.]